MEKKSYAASGQTKRAMADALKKLMAQKPLDKITIQELAEQCGMKRQNFYYHFEDIYDLLRWMFQEEAVSLLEQREGALLWQEGLLQLFRYLQENRKVCLCALKSLGRDYVKRFFRENIYDIIYRSVEQMEEKLGGSENDAEMLTHFYVISLAATVESWLYEEIGQTPEELVAFCDTMLTDHIRGAELRLRERREERARRGLGLTSRFSPGYGDLPLSVQPLFLDTVDAVRRIGLHMTPGDLMVPRKSVTALLGVGAAAEKRRSCETCALRETCQFTRGGRHCGR